MRHLFWLHAFGIKVNWILRRTDYVCADVTLRHTLVTPPRQHT